jgi:hypothetical protein
MLSEVIADGEQGRAPSDTVPLCAHQDWKAAFAVVHNRWTSQADPSGPSKGVSTFMSMLKFTAPAFALLATLTPAYAQNIRGTVSGRVAGLSYELSSKWHLLQPSGIRQVWMDATLCRRLPQTAHGKFARLLGDQLRDQI